MLNKILLSEVLTKIQTLELLRDSDGEAPAGDCWNQNTWASPAFDKEGNACGTAFCFAGWAAELYPLGKTVVVRLACDDLTGMVSVAPSTDVRSPQEHLERVREFTCSAASCYRVKINTELWEGMVEGRALNSFESQIPALPDGASLVQISAFARAALGLTDDEAALLFNAGNDLPILEAYVKGLLDDHPIEEVFRELTEGY